jgi:thiol-disulfide isomerase/thioredoxin
VVIVAGIIAYGILGSGSSPAAGPSTLAVGEVTGPALGQMAPAGGLLPVGTTAPDLAWTIDGKTDSLANARGNPVLLEFFATWCPHCQAEVPVTTQVATRFAPQGLRVVGVSASPLARDQRGNTSIADIQAFARTYGAQYPLLLDRALVGAQRYGVRSFPTIYLVDGNGVIRYATSGEVPEQELADAITPLLSGASS